MHSSKTSRCSWVRGFSVAVYDFLTDVFSYKLGFAELGMTDHFVFSMAKYAKATGGTDVEIYKTSWKIESVYGNDIDLFIQDKSGYYTWYALQAKIMSYNGAYRDIKGSKKQWELLADHERKFGSIAYYLLYNGKPSLRPPKNNPNRSDCLGVPTIHELGLGIVKSDIVGNIRIGKSKSSLFYFGDIFPDHIDSIRKIFCCEVTENDIQTKYSRAQISTLGYVKILYREHAEPSLNEVDEDTIDETKAQFEGAPIRIIVGANE